MSMTPTCRDSRCWSSASSCASAACGSTPFASRSRPRGPYSTTVDAWVQTAPTPARTCGTARPTKGTRVVTLAPDWPVAGSIAHSEKVEYCGRPSSLRATPSAARCCASARPGSHRATAIAAKKCSRVIDPPQMRRDVLSRSLEGYEGTSRLQTYGEAVLAQMPFERRHARLGVMKDRRGERGVRAAGREYVQEMPEAAGAAGGNHRNRDRGRDGGGERAIEASLRAIAVDRRQEDFAGAAAFSLAGPFDGVAIRRCLSAASVDGKAIADGFRIDRDEDRLAAIALGERGDERRLRERRGVEADLVGTGRDRDVCVRFR